ncbi:MAG: hypothetical protein ACYC6M_03660 [Terriglobales bacterium]
MDSAFTAIARAQALLDPTGQGLFPAARLLPYLNIAYSELRDEGVNAREITVSEAVVVLPAFKAYTADLGSYVAPGGVLEALANPLLVRERPAGGRPEDYTEVAPVALLAARSPAPRLQQYEWRGGNLYFVGATQDLDLEVRYEQILPAIKDVNDPLLAVGVANILGYWTAAKMAQAMREYQLAATYEARARHLLYLWASGQVKDAQAIVRRPRPFRGRY